MQTDSIVRKLKKKRAQKVPVFQPLSHEELDSIIQCSLREEGLKIKEIAGHVVVPGPFRRAVLTAYLEGGKPAVLRVVCRNGGVSLQRESVSTGIWKMMHRTHLVPNVTYVDPYVILSCGQGITQRIEWI